ncbi:TetR/AcrR family transcriptional regulator [Streptomyces sp. NBC_00365]|uniref:TetR/AcrR family transcriptional regulator n=1 Tax=Streptomyces sp. NBC_00365 TaxID=2975726 RepID=UPI0022590B64|nr:TetR/AcrR family transcriptional regulator [Streptomyces sp. NBC_00365]MCX5094770.1 TetR/AcrR family transcriptional regulator [Streptomyces sp. NBC_00365]
MRQDLVHHAHDPEDVGVEDALGLLDGGFLGRTHRADPGVVDQDVDPQGYYGTSTEAIAKRVGVTQPYLFRLFPGKKAIFVAALVRSMEDTRLAFERATDGMEGSEQARGAMADAYARLISARPETLLIQMQGYAVVGAAEAEGDDKTGELVRAGWMRLWETVHLSLGADVHATTGFFACGMLGNTLTAIGLPSDCREAGA